MFEGLKATGIRSVAQLAGRVQLRLEHLRLLVVRGDPLLPLSAVGVATGVLAGVVILLFRTLVESAQAAFLPGADPENYEGLAAWARFVLPVCGALLIGALFHLIPKALRSIGVVHVVERLLFYQGRLPLANALVQFFGSALSIISGHSVGREGPIVHLGAATGSQLGQLLRLPNNYLHTLVACGVAAAIAASFNTPLAGVVFAMEVVLMEYTVAGFAPVILAAVSATSIVDLTYGSALAFTVPPLHLGSLQELPLVMLVGLVTGALAALFIQTLSFFSRLGTGWPMWIRMTLGGLIVGLSALAAPEVMGIGYDTVNTALLGQQGALALAMIMGFKLLATTAGVGLGLPGGLIGPTFVVGAAAGGLVGVLVSQLVPGYDFSQAFYAMIGMGAMMGATLQAPLAALIAMLELTGNYNIIFPGMLAVITSVIAANKLFGKESIVLTSLRARGVDLRRDPVALSLGKIGVATVMNTSVATCGRTVSPQEVRDIAARQPQYLIIEEEGAAVALLPGGEIAQYLGQGGAEEGRQVDLLAAFPAHQKLESIDLRATLHEAFDKLVKSNVEALCVTERISPTTTRTYGVLTREDIEKVYRYRL